MRIDDRPKHAGGDGAPVRVAYHALDETIIEHALERLPHGLTELRGTLEGGAGCLYE